MLAVMGPERLARSMFPLGDVASKEETRAEAAARGLSVSAKPDSYDICFVADGDTQGFLRSRLGSQPGEIVDATGAVLGEHDGAYAFTVGQRRGLSIGRPAADGKPRYVLSVEPVNNRVVVGSADDLVVRTVEADRAVWFDGRAPSRSTARCRSARTAPPCPPGRPCATARSRSCSTDGSLRGVAPGPVGRPVRRHARARPGDRDRRAPSRHRRRRPVSGGDRASRAPDRGPASTCSRRRPSWSATSSTRPSEVAGLPFTVPAGRARTVGRPDAGARPRCWPSCPPSSGRTAGSSPTGRAATSPARRPTCARTSTRSRSPGTGGRAARRARPRAR